MKILTTIVSLEGDMSGTIYKMDTIEHEGKFWLVPMWLSAPTEGFEIPARIICLENLPHQKFPSGSAYGDFVLNQPLPKVLYEGRVPPELKQLFVVIERPNIQREIPKGIH